MTIARKAKIGTPEDELFLQPWFVSRSTYAEIRRVLPPSQMLKMRYYFEDYGCLKCGALDVLYCSNGLCRKCSIIIRARVALALKRRFKRIGANVPKEPFNSYLKGLFDRKPNARISTQICFRRAR